MRVRRRPATAVVVVAAALAVSGCSDATDLAPRAQRQLEAGVEQVRVAVAAADRPAARAALRALEQLVRALADDAQIDASRAEEILTAASEVTDQLALLPAQPSPSPSPTSEPTESPPPSDAEDEGGVGGDGNGDGDGDQANGDDGGGQGHGNRGGNGNGNAYGHDQGNGG